ncbi:unnamed protein product [Lactuca saligna]|uniref:Uncharacterized protein n=1 Tax=Lactuca saligna TaxID=75948 RepID=A0AA35VMB3_LACSI|nr:unnamed protein product [Lactuca saligna]
MAGSSETTSSADQSTSFIMLNLKPCQNHILDLDSSRYNEPLRPMVECLRYSPLAQALIMVESIPLVHLSKAYSSATYIKVDGVITFKVATNMTSINKAYLCRMLGIELSEVLVDPDSDSSIDLINMFYHMGYIGDISLLSNFRKPNLPPM